MSRLPGKKIDSWKIPVGDGRTVIAEVRLDGVTFRAIADGIDETSKDFSLLKKQVTEAARLQSKAVLSRVLAFDFRGDIDGREDRPEWQHRDPEDVAIRSDFEFRLSIEEHEQAAFPDGSFSHREYKPGVAPINNPFRKGPVESSGFDLRRSVVTSSALLPVTPRMIDAAEQIDAAFRWFSIWFAEKIRDGGEAFLGNFADGAIVLLEPQNKNERPAAGKKRKGK